MPRIVAGQARGRRLSRPAGVTRPTSDRVREALFNSLDATIRLEGARVLDLFAGTGAVGLEALSRGARAAVLVEKDRRALEVLRRNVAAVGVPGADVVAAPVSRYLAAAPPQPFDLVFADPPYDIEDEQVEELLAALGGDGWLAEDALVVVERRVGSTPSAGGGGLITPVREKRYGDTVLWYGRRR